MENTWNQLVSSVHGEKANCLTGKEPGKHAGRVLRICKKMLLKGIPDSPRLDFALEKERKFEYCGC